VAKAARISGSVRRGEGGGGERQVRYFGLAKKESREQRIFARKEGRRKKKKKRKRTNAGTNRNRKGVLIRKGTTNKKTQCA